MQLTHLTELTDSDLETAVKRLAAPYVPAHVRRAVWIRDGGRCRFVGKTGHRCDARAFLEFHHLDPEGVGGEASEWNIELRCRAHNQYEAVLFYGSGVQQRMTRGTGRPAHSLRNELAHASRERAHTPGET